MSDGAAATIRITVFGYSEREVCWISGCGARVGSREAAAELRATFAATSGGRVVVHHFDLAQPDLAEHFADVLQGARERNLPFPLIAINGDIVFAGPPSVETVLRKLSEFATAI